MALHIIRSAPSFTKAMRGYDIDEVDEYVDALHDTEDKQAEEHRAVDMTNQALKADVERLTARIAELEACIRSETPRSIAALGERLTLVLEEAEAGAEETLRSAHDEAEALLSSARATADEDRTLAAAQAAETERMARVMLVAAEERASTLEAAAERRSETLVREAEGRALTRKAEIDDWVEAVRTHIEGEEARASAEFARLRAVRYADLVDLRRRQEELVASLMRMGSTLEEIVTSARATGADDDITGSMPALRAAGRPPVDPPTLAARTHEVGTGDANPEADEDGIATPPVTTVEGWLSSGRPGEDATQHLSTQVSPEMATAETPSQQGGRDHGEVTESVYDGYDRHRG